LLISIAKFSRAGVDGGYLPTYLFARAGMILRAVHRDHPMAQQKLVPFE